MPIRTGMIWSNRKDTGFGYFHYLSTEEAGNLNLCLHKSTEEKLATFCDDMYCL